ncbi:right-handed parallel beta-helix repeat-containing protein [Janthinobacterium sp. PAMC25594]|uniref:right-handed parallel beta-helix repeat-containing protein n=1 Tax=Janthinobacterium sp. PAMC25594 TaxID=2861284 RepID=UPI001C626ED4|nr:right-handed parallel beta-helix repeat-containing protein [Janthinobacterium sp. PAMC25594]QYG06666.1 right-handed parallel beta-helix repeat-containing protein [Janthinobacterium sp. PAMC25594]
MSLFSFPKPARRRTKFLGLLVLLLIAWLFWPRNETRPLLNSPIPSTLESQSCIDLRPEDETFQEAIVLEAGRYCVAVDFWQRRFCGAGHCAPAAYRHLLDISGGDVTIDLRNHTLHSDGHSSGIVAYTQSNKGSMERDNPNFSFSQKTTRITIQNSVIDLRGGGTGVEFINHGSMLFIETQILGRTYEKTEFILENLRIITDNTSVILEGDGNIVRNCIIESGGVAAIMMAGPNGQILNNTIILTNPFIPGDMRATEFNEPRDFPDLIQEKMRPKAAIALHQATGTVISGNRIEVKGPSATRHNIYLTDASENIRIEGNTFVGSEDPVRLLKGSTATMKNNVFEPRKPWWKF